MHISAACSLPHFRCSIVVSPNTSYADLNDSFFHSRTLPSSHAEANSLESEENSIDVILSVKRRLVNGPRVLKGRI